MEKVIRVMVACSVLLAGCAGRTANPIAPYLPGDENRSCEGLKVEISQLQADMQQILPKTDKGLTNALWAAGGVFVIVPFFFMDLKDAEKVEFEAMRTRHNHLLVYAVEKDCDMTGVRAERILSPAEIKEQMKKTKKINKEIAKIEREIKKNLKAQGNIETKIKALEDKQLTVSDDKIVTEIEKLETKKEELEAKEKELEERKELLEQEIGQEQ
jgi:chromosome segregation ATPase